MCTKKFTATAYVTENNQLSIFKKVDKLCIIHNRNTIKQLK